MIRARLAAIMVATFIAAVLPWLSPVQTLEGATLRLRYKIRGPIQRTNQIVIAAIDDRTEREWKAIPKAFWAGEIAKLLTKLNKLGAAKVGLDMLFQGDPDSYLSGIGSQHQPISELDNAIFESRGRTILGTTPGSVLSPGLDDASDGRELASLDGLQVGRTPVSRLPTEDRSFAPPRRTLAAALANSTRSTPVTINYTMVPPTVFSISDILDDRVDPAEIRGKIVIVGETYRSTDDREDTPVADGIPGVLIQAEAVDTLLNNRELQKPNDETVSLGIAALALGLGFWMIKGAYSNGMFITVGLLTGWILIAFWSFETKQWVLPVIVPLLTGLIVVPSIIVPVLSAQGRAQLAWTRAQWGQMMPDGFINRLEARRRGGLGTWNEFHAVVLFADIEGFSARTNQANPEALVNQLNEIFECLVEPIQQQGGVVLNFLGDGLCAMFEINERDRDSLEAKRQAIAAAVAARKRVERLPGDDALGVRFGVTSGTVTLALIGSSTRRQMTIYGAAVNLSARLEQAVKSERERIGCPEAWLLCTADFEQACRENQLKMTAEGFTPKGWKEQISYLLGPDHSPNEKIQPM